MKKIALIIDKFDAAITEIEKTNSTQLIQLNQKIKRTKDCLNELRQEVKMNGFISTKKEIHFFKNQKPYIKGRLKFYVSLNSYLLKKPTGSKSKQRKFVNLQLSQIETENCKYIDFVNYYLLEETKKDHTYFLRGVEQFELFIDNTTIFEDPEFCTLRDHLASKIIAKKLLIQFYTNELENYKKKNSKQKIKEIQRSPNSVIPWSGTKTELIELISGLNSNKSIGNGNLSIKELNEICKVNFGIDPGNIYKILDQISARKMNPTKYLDKLVKSQLNDLEQQWKKL